jgi:DNA-binding SARP family transcriptional activator
VLHIRALGPAAVRFNDRVVSGTEFGGAKPRELLWLLALNAGRPMQKDTIAALLWDGEPPASWLSTLEGYVSLLRRAVQPGGRPQDSVIRTRRGGYLLDLAQVDIDLKTFDDLVIQADATSGAAALPMLRAALAIANGDLFDGENAAVWMVRARVRHGERVRRAALRAAQLALDEGAHDAAIAFADRVTDVDATCEQAARIAMLAHWRAGRRTDALSVYRRCKDALRAELGISPDRLTEQLHLSVLRDESDVEVA